jgi:hypothetical protein
VNCIIDWPDQLIGIRIKASRSAGDVSRNVFMEDVKVGAYKDGAISFNMFYGKRATLYLRHVIFA